MRFRRADHDPDVLLVVLVLVLGSELTRPVSCISDCHTSMFGCCADGVTVAEGPNMESCPALAMLPSPASASSSSEAASPSAASTCHNTTYGCCPDDPDTPASGPGNLGCVDYSCRDSEYGCCDDFVTAARTDTLDDCPLDCVNSSYGCCPDGKTTSRGPGMAGCPRQETTAIESTTPLVTTIVSTEANSCASTEFECCPDGRTPASGPAFQGCADQSLAHRIAKSNRITEHTCLLPEPAKKCQNYSSKWRFDAEQGICVPFWFDGCETNANLFATADECHSKCVKPNGTERCKLPLVNPAKQCEHEADHTNVTRYYYDMRTSSCKAFVYSGCDGNANNFESLNDCESRCQLPLLFEQCSTIPDRGLCMGQHERWYFDSKHGRCKTFTYGGCMRQRNNHVSETQCVESCVRPKQRLVCLLPRVRGTCEQQINRWHYDVVEGVCKLFVYTGCNGNLNRFETRDACEYTCQGLLADVDVTTTADNTAALALYSPPPPPRPASALLKHICHAPKVTGACNLDLQRWYYNSTTQMCHQFTYSGCDGSANNFESELDCRHTCNAKEADPCVLPVDYGTCDRYSVYFYFNEASRECVGFYYGGCDGNPNRFETRIQCEMTCKLSALERSILLRMPEQCLMPLEYGANCAPSAVSQWYFDLATRICYPFEYSGCGPTKANRFATSDECHRFCVQSLANATESAAADAAAATAAAATKSPPIVAVVVDPMDVCELAVAKGNCTQSEAKWFYDSAAKYCRQFEFTGCNGNANKFETRYQCAEICETPKRREICHSSKVQGPCFEDHTRWFFNPETRSCQTFRYGGCYGNQNNFESVLDCVNLCWNFLSEEAKAISDTPASSTPASTPAATTDDAMAADDGAARVQVDVCTLELDDGRQSECATQGNATTQLRWYFDTSMRECRTFTYLSAVCSDSNSNRGAASNNFETRAKCELECDKDHAPAVPTTQTSNSACEQAVELTRDDCPDELRRRTHGGNVSDSTRVWYYDVETRACRRTTVECYPHSASNRFDTHEQCKRQCLPDVNEEEKRAQDCMLPMSVGEQCELQVWRWYFEPQAGECYMFSYSGCHGNNNHFLNKASCLRLCSEIDDRLCPSLVSHPMWQCTEACADKRWRNTTNCGPICECYDRCHEHQSECGDDEECAIDDETREAICRPRAAVSTTTTSTTTTTTTSTTTTAIPANDDDNDLSRTDKQQAAEIVEFAERALVLAGDTLSLPCVVEPAWATVTWFKNHLEMTYTSRVFYEPVGSNHTLKITRADETDEAIYTCRATTSTGTANAIDKAASRETNVVVHAAPFFVGLTTPNASGGGVGESRSLTTLVNATTLAVDRYELLGLDAFLTCNISARPAPRFEWRNAAAAANGALIHTSRKHMLYANVLRFKSFDKNDIGNYTCTASNGIGQPLHVRFSLNRAESGMVKFVTASVDAHVNASVQLKCKVSGVPKSSITWLLPGNRPLAASSMKYQLLDDDTVLRIERVSASDAGTYRCSAYNHFSHASMRKKYGSIVLRVNAKPLIVSDSRRFVVKPNTATRLALPCQTSQQQQQQLSAKIDWFKDSQQISFTEKQQEPNYGKYEFAKENGSLIVTGLEQADRGVYTCVANLYATAGNVTATLKHSLEVTSHERNMSLSVNESDAIALSCFVGDDEALPLSSPPPTVRWFYREHKSALANQGDNDNEINNSNNNNNMVGEKLVLRLDQVEGTQSGIYECRVETESSVYITRIELNVTPATTTTTTMMTTTTTTTTTTETTTTTTPETTPTTTTIATTTTTTTTTTTAAIVEQQTTVPTRTDAALDLVVVEAKHSEVRAISERAVVLDCAWWLTSNDEKLFRSAASKAAWYLNGSPLVLVDEISQQQHQVEDSNELTQRAKYEHLDKWRTMLRINNVRPLEANHTYMCSISIDKHHVKQSTFTLFVGVAPFTRRQGNMTTIEFGTTSLPNTYTTNSSSDSIRLECPIDGLPEPTKRWQFIGLVNDSTTAPVRHDLDAANYGDGGSLVLWLSDMDESFQGVYACNASNEFGSLVFAYDLRLANTTSAVSDQQSYALKPMAQKPTKISVPMFEDVSLKCNTANGDENSMIQSPIKWRHNGDALVGVVDDQSGGKYSLSDQSRTLAVRNATRSDGGEYACVNEAAESPNSRTFIVSVIERPTIEFEPMSPVLVFADSPQVTTINCRVGNKHAFVKPDDGGESSLRFAWLYPNGTRITMDNKNDYNWRISIKSSQLRIVKARLSDSGKYACQVSVDELVFVKHVFVKVLTSAELKEHQNQQKQPDEMNNCYDVVSQSYCKIVAHRGLCDKYSYTCCKTCSAHASSSG